MAAPHCFNYNPSGDQVGAALKSYGAVHRTIEAEALGEVGAGFGVAEDELGEGVGFRCGNDVCVIHVFNFGRDAERGPLRLLVLRKAIPNSNYFEGSVS